MRTRISFFLFFSGEVLTFKLKKTQQKGGTFLEILSNSKPTIRGHIFSVRWLAGETGLGEWRAVFKVVLVLVGVDYLIRGQHV